MRLIRLDPDKVSWFLAVERKTKGMKWDYELRMNDDYTILPIS